MDNQSDYIDTLLSASDHIMEALKAWMHYSTDQHDQTGLDQAYNLAKLLAEFQVKLAVIQSELPLIQTYNVTRH